MKQDRTTFENTFNDPSTGLFKDNIVREIGADDSRTLVENLTDSFLNLVDGGIVEGFTQFGTTGTVPITAQNIVSKKSSNAATGSILNAIFYIDQTVATTGGGQGVEGYVKSSNSTGTIVLNIGAVGNLEHSGSGTLQYGRCVQGGGIVSGSGTITDLAGFFSTFAITGSGTITTYYGLYLETPSEGGGTITNRYGVYSQDPDAINFFAGSVHLGSASQIGTATLAAGTVTVSNANVTSNSMIFVTGQNLSGAQGILAIGARTPGVSFEIRSSNGADTSTVSWLIFEP